jgi:DNA-binding Lrp family transcriptional regulator
MEHSLDRTDLQILTALQNDGRLSNKELAAHVGLAPSSCLERVRRLRASGVLRGFRAEVAPEAFGIHLQAMIAVQLRRQDGELLDRFEREALARHEVLALYYVAGPDDFLLHVAAKDTDHLRRIVSDLPCSRLIAHVQTALIFAHKARPALPDYHTAGAARPAPSALEFIPPRDEPDEDE